MFLGRSPAYLNIRRNVIREKDIARIMYQRVDERFLKFLIGFSERLLERDYFLKRVFFINTKMF